VDQKSLQKKKILIVDNSDEVCARLADALGALGHDVVATRGREEALARADLDEFDLIVSDLAENIAEESVDDSRKRLMVSAPSWGKDEPHETVKAFKLAVSGEQIKISHETAGLKSIIEQILTYKAGCADSSQNLDHVREKIDLELPSDLSLMSSVLQYLLDRLARLGLIQPEQSNLFVALDEAFVNAVKHGNKNDPSKLLRITAELSTHEAIFTVEDEGQGFDVKEIPDPCDPANLFKTSGRGVMLMFNIMDEVEYNAQGNRVRMVKRSQGSQGPNVPAR
jgi:serine/threonine-protein kinase RsbW